ncbi:hypothetical protein PILCRDRAFT_205539 [Piloderma croceum F 1598]|uniref:Uncharacterized protein n=1 Tax=Piloderma croceum (strain F 1598) TaxID=765440 RepID=A0A0C3G198_PILCF|nr:hypothetical protein PILCRDRAFT_205539 [Piloderma croceum F 1598]
MVIFEWLQTETAFGVLELDLFKLFTGSQSSRPYPYSSGNQHEMSMLYNQSQTTIPETVIQIITSLLLMILGSISSNFIVPTVSVDRRTSKIIHRAGAPLMRCILTNIPPKHSNVGTRWAQKFMLSKV